MIVLVGHHDKQGVVLGDGVCAEPRKEFSERGVILLELGDVAGFARAECPRTGAIVMRVGDIKIDHLDAGLEHRRGIT